MTTLQHLSDTQPPLNASTSREQPETLIIPGLGGSGPHHWQTWLERQVSKPVRVSQPNWDNPDIDQWAGVIARAIDAAMNPPILVAHSFGVLGSVKAVSRARRRISGALFVAPADPEIWDYARLLPELPLPYPSILVASRNDTWMKFEAAERWGTRWGSKIVDAGNAAHLNVASGHGPWPAVMELWQSLVPAAGGNKRSSVSH